jgi:hypothetical protein
MNGRLENIGLLEKIDSAYSTSSAASEFTQALQDQLLEWCAATGVDFKSLEQTKSPKKRRNPRESELLKKARKARNLARKARSKARKNKDREAARKHHLECLKLHNRIKAREKKLQEQKDMNSASKLFFKNPWSYCKRVIEGIKEAVLPKFDLSTAREYFGKLFSDSDSQGYEYPPWLKPKDSEANVTPVKLFTEIRLQKLLAGKKAWSAAGEDQFLNALFKHMPCLHPYLVVLFNRILQERSFPDSWKRGKFVLIYKKNDPAVPKNFRPVCLTSVVAKLFTSALASHAANHMRVNDFLCKSQKGFLEKVSGCIEHQYTIQEAISKAKSTGKSQVVLIMTDLTHAFDSVRHQLIEFALRHYKFSDDFIDLVRSIYDGLSVSLQVGDEECSFDQTIGVFQGDPLSPILFNIVLNLVLEPLSDPKTVQDHGVTLTKEIRVTNCAFADDVNLMARSVSSAQVLLKIFDKALSWTRCLKPAPMKFASIAYGKMESTNQFSAYNPKLNFRGIEIPFLGENNCLQFRILGRQFAVNIKDSPIRDFVKTQILSILDKIDKDVIAPNIKLEILKKSISYFRWHLLVHPIPPSWIEEHIKPKYVAFIKKWTGGRRCQNTDLYFARTGLGLGLPDIVTLAKECQIQRCFTLKNSRDKTIQELFAAEVYRLKKNRSTSAASHHWKGPLELDFYEQQAKEKSGDNWNRMGYHTRRRAITKLMTQEGQVKHQQILESLEMQGSAIREVSDSVQDGGYEWTRTLTGLSPKLLSFGINGITNTLATADNLKRWGYLQVDEKCDLCGELRPTITHVLSMCRGALGELEDNFNRIKWRHDSVLKILYSKVAQVLQDQGFVENFVDLQSHVDEYHHFPEDLLITEQRPDMIFVDRASKRLILAELTVPMESRLIASNQLKISKYESLVLNLKNFGWNVKFFAVEVSTRGFISTSLAEFLHSIKFGKGKARSLKHSLSLQALECSRIIFCNRKNKFWPRS